MPGCLKGMFVITAADAIACNSGIAVSLVHNAAGDNSIALSESWDPADTRFVAVPIAAIAASGLRSAGVSRPDATHVRVTAGIEQGGGAASALTSMDTLVLCFSTRGSTPRVSST